MNGYTRESGAKRKNAIIAGITNPTNRLHTPHTPNQYGNNSRASSSNSSKRRFEHIQFEKPRSKTKKPKVEDQVLSIFDEAKSDEVKSVSGMGRGFKSQTGSSKEASVNISSEEESPDHKDSLQSKSKIPVEIPGRKGSSGKTKWVLRTSQLEPKKKVRALISAPSNKKQKREKWELSAFHRGTRHIKEPDLHLEVSSTIKEFQLKLFQGENELDVGPISDNKVSKVLVFFILPQSNKFTDRLLVLSRCTLVWARTE